MCQKLRGKSPLLLSTPKFKTSFLKFYKWSQFNLVYYFYNLKGGEPNYSFRVVARDIISRLA